MIVDRLLAYLGGDRVLVTDELLDAAMRIMRASLKRNLGAAPESARTYISASSPWYCPTRMYYTVAGAPRGDVAPRSRVAFLIGDVMEQVVVLLMRLSGIPLLSPDAAGLQHNLVVRIGGVDVPCHPDASLAVPWRANDGSEGTEEVPVEIKSMAERSFDQFQRATSDPAAEWWDSERWGYVAQVRFQMRAMGERQGRASTSRGILVGVCKNTGHLAELHVPFDQATFEVFNRAVPMTHQWVAAGTPPPRPVWAQAEARNGSNLLPDGRKGACLELAHWRCGYCPFTATCWPGFGLVPLAGGPRWRKAMDA